MSVIDKVQALQLPDDQYVVIGSGLLDAWGLRESHDVDLVVSGELFESLARSGRYTLGSKPNGDRFLSDDTYEIFDNWGEEGTFEQLYRYSIMVDTVRFVSPDYLIRQKADRGWEKDLQDIMLIQEKMTHDHAR